jgi:anti-sigma-K factor RskA
MKLQGQALQQVAAAYALGSLGPRARRRFEALLARDLMARRAWQQWEERLAVLGQDLPPVRPPDTSWQAIESRLGQKPPPRAWTRRWTLLAALVLAAAVALVWTRTASR